MKIKNVDYLGVIGAGILCATLLVFPFINPCETEDGSACTWYASTAGNNAGASFTDYYGITLYHP